MPKALSTDEEFIELFEGVGPTELARRLGMGVRAVHQRREALERRYGRSIKSPNSMPHVPNPTEVKARLHLDIDNGVVIVGSDAHYWPGCISTAHRAFVKLIDEMVPKAVVINGDIIDGATISRHAPIGWERRPSLVQEIEECKDRLGEITAAIKKKSTRLVWPVGNHDARFETRLATVAPEYAKLHGVHLKDHFPGWEPCWSLCVNDDTVIKHRFRGGIHAAHNNTLWSGKTIITGHLHSLKVIPFSDYNGTRWGVDTGTLAEPYGPQFLDYTEDGPKNWRAGFVVLTFVNGELLWPEIVDVRAEGVVGWRGKLITV